jgi:hypothetical protein
MTKAELTAENKPARERSQCCIAAKGTQEPTKIKAVLRSPLCFVMYPVLYSGVSRLYIAWKSSLGSSFLIGWKYMCKASWMRCRVSLEVKVDPACSETHHRGSTLIGLSLSLSLVEMSGY